MNKKILCSTVLSSLIIGSLIGNSYCVFNSVHSSNLKSVEKAVNLKQKTNDKNIPQKKDISSLESKERDWYYDPVKDRSIATVPEDVNKLLKSYCGYFLGDSSKKNLYLTFDEGYENGYTGKILDILKSNNVKAAFFVTAPYIKQNPDLIKRMEKEGHIVGNHSDHHPSMAKSALKGQENFNKEFTVVEDLYKETTGKTMPKFFRPPMGKYSELSLYNTQQLGYKTIFWSFAYQDWDRNKQPSVESAKSKINNRIHNGSIILLHAVSKTNSEILDSVLKDLKKDGFEFKSLNELPTK